MKGKNVSIFVCLTLVLATFAFVSPNVGAVTEEEIEQAITDGIAWLVSQQDGVTGKWEDVPRTGFVLIKLQDRAYELDKDPFQTDPDAEDYYEYATNVIDGWEYLFSVDGAGNPIYARKQSIDNQDHTGGASGTIDDPDTRDNDYGIYFTGNTVYHTGICLMALAASEKPGRLNDGNIDYDGDGNVETFGEIAQDVVDWLAWAQGDSGAAEGGFYYGALDDDGAGADNSNSGYAYLGLAAGEGFGCTVPDWVKTELDVWIDFIQDDASGGSAYATWNTGWINELKTGNLIFEMTFYGDTEAISRYQDALDYIENHWQDANLQPGWIGDYGVDDDGDGLVDEDPKDGIDNDLDGLVDEDIGMVHYQAMYCLMKGLEYSQEDYLDLDGDDIPEHDWFEEFAEVLLNRQNADGSWPSSPCYVWPGGSWGTMSGKILSTLWALLTLEKISPPPPEIEVDVDIKPGSCPNPLNVKSNGVIPITICGTEDLDVTTIDPDTILLTREGFGEGVPPLRWSYEDVATPYTGEEECGCHDLNGDGIMDLSLKFSKREAIMTLELDYEIGNVIPLMITGNLVEEEGGTAIVGQDCMWILPAKEKTNENPIERTRSIYQIFTLFLQQHPNMFPILRNLLKI